MSKLPKILSFMDIYLLSLGYIIGAGIFVLIGDGELAEGSNFEAMLLSAHHKLDNLILIIDHNNL